MAHFHPRSILNPSSALRQPQPPPNSHRCAASTAVTCHHGRHLLSGFAPAGTALPGRAARCRQRPAPKESPRQRRGSVAGWRTDPEARRKSSAKSQAVGARGVSEG